MEYRKLPHGGEKISIIGLGNSSLGPAGEAEIERIVRLAIENGVNYFDMAAYQFLCFSIELSFTRFGVITCLKSIIPVPNVQAAFL